MQNDSRAYFIQTLFCVVCTLVFTIKNLEPSTYILEYVSLSRFYKKKLDIKAKKIRQILIKRYLGISNFIAGSTYRKVGKCYRCIL